MAEPLVTEVMDGLSWTLVDVQRVWLDLELSIQQCLHASSEPVLCCNVSQSHFKGAVGRFFLSVMLA